MPRRSGESRETDERRDVEVDEPRLSPEVNAMLTDEVREVVGADAVDVPAGRERPSRGEPVAHRRRLPLPFPLPDDFALVQVGAALVVVAAIAALAVVVHHWWTLALAVLVLLCVLYLVVATIMKMTGNPERPSAAAVAAMEEEGMHDPEQFFSDVVDELTSDAEGGNVRRTAVEDDPARAAAEQRDATTPSGGPSEPAGPGD